MSHSNFSPSDLVSFSFRQLQEGFQKKQFSVPDVLEAYIQRMQDTTSLNIYITPTLEQARHQAKISQQRYEQGTQRPLEGFPMAIKDAFCTRGIRTTAASKILENFIPPYESSVSQKLFDQGMLLLGKVNMDEFCMGSSTQPIFTGATLNPWNPSCSTGGSSGGSVAAVASGAALGAFGTDTGGSIRQPASFCGVVGLKPTYGLCSRWGVIAFASSCDTPSPTARSMEDLAPLLQASAGWDPKDPSSSRRKIPSYMEALNRCVKGVRIGIPENFFNPKDMHPDVLERWEESKRYLEEKGCILCPIQLPHAPYALHIYYIITSAEAASNLARYDGIKYGFRGSSPKDTSISLEALYCQTRTQGFGPEVKRRIMLGTFVLSQGYAEAYYKKAQMLRRCIQKDFSMAFSKVDVILTPCTPTPAFPLEERENDPMKMYLNDLFTVPVNMGSVCAAAIPVGTCQKGMPIGMQLIAPPFEEPRLFHVGSCLEKMRPSHFCLKNSYPSTF